jgi:hypothetical protein
MSQGAPRICKSEGINSALRQLWIERFELSNVNNVSGTNNGYGNFTSQTINANAGSSYNFIIETGRNGLRPTFYGRIWADLNNNGDFNDPGELLAEDSTKTILTGTLTIPANTLPNTVRLRVAVKRSGYAPSCWHYSRGETEDYNLQISSSACLANAGTLTASNSLVCFNAGGSILTASQNAAPVIPSGYRKDYVLTSGAGLVIQQVSATPSFTVTGTGLFTIHTLVYDPTTLNLGIVIPGTTTGFDVNSLLIQGGGSICASLDVAGAQFNVENPQAGTLTPKSTNSCFTISSLLEATPNGNSIVPAGYQTIYVLTSGAGLVIEQVSSNPSFTVTQTGTYTIHTLVYNPATLDLSIVVPGTTTGFDVNGLLVQGGGSICASLDVAGAQFIVGNPSAGTLTSTPLINCLDGGNATLTASPNGNSVQPSGFQTIYVLTRGLGLVIQQVSATPTFNVSQIGFYRIHTLVYNPATLDLSTVVLGTTTGFDVNSLLIQGGGSICGSLDVTGAPFIVLPNFICNLLGFGDFVSTYNNQSEVPANLIRMAETGELSLLIQNIYPNPATDLISLDYIVPVEGRTIITIFNAMGQQVASNQFDDLQGFVSRRIDVSELSSGNYLMRVENNNTVQTSRFNVKR